MTDSPRQTAVLAAAFALAFPPVRKRHLALAQTSAPDGAGRPCGYGRARPLPRHDLGLQRLPHAVEDGRTGPEPDMSRMLSGHPAAMRAARAAEARGAVGHQRRGTNTAWSGPWGVSFTANLTPDPETGLGKWT